MMEKQLGSIAVFVSALDFLFSRYNIYYLLLAGQIMIHQKKNFVLVKQL